MTAKPQSEPAIPILQNGNGTTSSCWSCGDMRAAHFCDSCGSVQPPLPTDYFSFFGLPRKLNIDPAVLERTFYKLSRKLHPDVYGRATSLEQNWSLEKTSQLNDAYRTLKDPVARTEYLLKLEGVKLGEQSKKATEQARDSGREKKQAVPPDMLEEVFELNMQLEEARLNKKVGEADAGLLADLSAAKTRLEQKFAALTAELKARWDQWDALIARGESGESVSDVERTAVRDRLVDVLNRRMYIRNLARDVNEVLAAD
jgi:molecular chaperone HscB